MKNIEMVRKGRLISCRELCKVLEDDRDFAVLYCEKNAGFNLVNSDWLGLYSLVNELG
jgi:hypothetical protein